MKSKKPQNRKNRRSFSADRKENFMYFENAVVIETLPGTSFKVKVTRTSPNPDKELPPIFIVCSLKAVLIKRRVLIVKGDTVVVETNPEDMYYDEEENILKGIIIERK